MPSAYRAPQPWWAGTLRVYESWPQSAMTTGLEVLPDWEPTAWWGLGVGVRGGVRAGNMAPAAGLRPPGWLQGNYSECSHGAKRASMALTTSMPPVTEPKTTCLPSSQSVLTVHLRGQRGCRG